MDALQRKLTQLLDTNDLELRTAAVQVITELGISSKTVTQALARCLREPNESLRLVALRGLARLGANDVAHLVVPLLLTAGPLREQAMAVISAVGESVIPLLTALYPQADFHGKRAVITALARIESRRAISFLLKILPQEPFELQKHLTLSICEALDRLSPAVQTPIFSQVVRALRGKAALKSPQILITGAILLGHFRGPKLAAKSRLHLRLLGEKKHPPEVRRHALVSFNRLLSEGKLTSPDEDFLYRTLCDEDWQNVAQHALTGFQRLEFPKQRLSKLVALLRDSPHFSVHIHVFERLQTIDRPEVGEAIIPFLSDPRFRVREAAEAALRKMPSAIESLFTVLMKADDLEVTQRVNSILRDFPQETRKRYLERACARLLNLFDQNDPHYRSFLDFVRSVDPEPLRKRIYERGRALKVGRAKDKWERLAAYLQLLWDNHLITAEGRYLLGVAHVRMSNKDPAPASRRANLGLQVLRSLIYDDHAALAKKLTGDKDLTPEDFFYLGFHFSEAGEEMRPFAAAILEHVVKKYPKSRVAGSAAHKLELTLKAGESQKGPLGEAGVEAGTGGKKVKAGRGAVASVAGRPAPALAGGGGVQDAASRPVASKPIVAEALPARGLPAGHGGAPAQGPGTAAVAAAARAAPGPGGRGGAASGNPVRGEAVLGKPQSPGSLPAPKTPSVPKNPKKMAIAAKNVTKITAKNVTKKPTKKRRVLGSAPKGKRGSPGPLRIKRGGAAAAAKKAFKKPSRSSARGRRQGRKKS